MDRPSLGVQDDGAEGVPLGRIGCPPVAWAVHDDADGDIVVALGVDEGDVDAEAVRSPLDIGRGAYR
jgi:hypothetical protein